MADPGDLSNLADIAVPPPVPWWPLAPGWWIVAATLLGAAAIIGMAFARRYRANAYRRAAMAALAAIGPASDKARAAAVSSVLKRAALVAYPRTEVASLSGPAWLAFLDRTTGATDFTQGAAAGLGAAAADGPLGDGQAILAAAQSWVRRHRALA